jgi:aminoglycoside phosphotransferase family enzyme
MSSIIDDLRKRNALPDKTQGVSLIQTHISIVFVADNFVYKVKKPVNFGFLDFSTLEKRKYYCLQEVRLNRRLSKGVYIDVLPVTFDGKKHSLKDTSGEIVEYAVKMKRIPEQNLMKNKFEKGVLDSNHLKRIAEVLSEFHGAAQRTPEIDKFGKPDKFKINTDENFDQVEKYIGITIEKGIFDQLKKWTNGFYQKNNDLFMERIKAGKIRDCHGDLHMEHVCISEDIDIIDCIEFNDRFRYSDTIADIAFLIMDLEYHGGKEAAKRLWENYQEMAHEGDVYSLLNFYKVYRAFVRGKVIGFQVDDNRIPEETKKEAIKSADSYFQLAYSYTEG